MKKTFLTTILIMSSCSFLFAEDSISHLHVKVPQIEQKTLNKPVKLFYINLSVEDSISHLHVKVPQIKQKTLNKPVKLFYINLSVDDFGKPTFPQFSNVDGVDVIIFTREQNKIFVSDLTEHGLLTLSYKTLLQKDSLIEAESKQKDIKINSLNTIVENCIKINSEREEKVNNCESLLKSFRVANQSQRVETNLLRAENKSLIIKNKTLKIMSIGTGAISLVATAALAIIILVN